VAILFILQASLDYPMDMPFLGLGALVFLMNLLLILAPLVAWSFLIDARALSILSIFSSAGFAALNLRKITERGAPIELLDFYNLQVSPVLLKYMGVREILGLVAILCLPFGFRYAVNRYWSKRRPWGVPHFAYISISFLLVIYFTAICAEPFRDDSFLLDQFPPHPDHADASRRNGLPLATILNLKFIRVFHPNNYNEEVIRKIVSIKPQVAPASMPNNNVVLILLESFRDYSLDGVPFHDDVLPFYHQLKKESVVGNYYSPVLGGGTANVEFEVLTGMSMAFLPADSIPHEQYINQPTPAVVGWLAKFGYDTYSIHDNFGSYYNRVNVFKTLRFKQFFASKELTSEFGRFKGPGYPDRTVFEKSIRLFSASPEKPQFQYLITMNTHGPYSGTKSEKSWVSPGTYEDPTIADELNVYADRMHRLDGDLKWYFEQLKKLKNPPTVIMFGDHHPSMSVRMPFPDEGSRHKVEVVMWNNKTGLVAPQKSQIMPCVSSMILHSAGVPLTPYFEFIQNMCATHDFHAPLALTGKNAQEFASYEILCYDRLFGEKFSTPNSLEKKGAKGEALLSSPPKDAPASGN